MIDIQAKGLVYLQSLIMLQLICKKNRNQANRQQHTDFRCFLKTYSTLLGIFINLTMRKLENLI
jgi:hypothetical protein